MSEQVEKTSEQLKKLIEELWNRARINAFAHREATNEYRRKDSIWFLATILFSLCSIFAIILSYITRNSIESPDSGKFYTLFSSLDYALFSIFATFISLITTIYSNHRRYSFISEQHRFIQNSYIHIAQKTRIAKSPTIDNTKLTELYNDLERDFADMKSRGIEPQDKHFNNAHKIVRDRKKDEISSKALSFDI